MMKLNPGDAIPTGVLLAYGIYHYPISVHPEHVIERYDRMTNDAGESVEVTLATEKIYDRELCESGVDNRKLASTMSFVSRSDDVFARGFIPGKFKVAIGLPHYFNYESKADVDAVDLDALLALKRRPDAARRWRLWWTELKARFGHNSNSSSDVSDGNVGDGGDDAIDWTSPAGVAYKESLLLSPMAKRFAISRTVDLADKMHLVFSVFIGYLGVEIAYGFYRFSLNRLTPVQKRMLIKPIIIACTVVGVAVMNLFFQLRNAVIERWADDATAQIGPDYADGGIEYYEKMLSRNRAMRELLGEEGERRFHPDGNIRAPWPWSGGMEDSCLPFYHRPYTARKRSCLKLKADFDAMTLEALAEHLEIERIHRIPQEMKMRMPGVEWRSHESQAFETSAGMREFEIRQYQRRKGILKSTLPVLELEPSESSEPTEQADE